MIRQSGVNPAGMVIDPQPVTTPTTEPEGRWRGWEVIQSGASAFVRSLHPFYDPFNSHRHLPVQDVADSAAGIDLWGVETNNFQQFTALAGRAIAAYSGLPSEINSLLSYLANLAVVGRFAIDQLNAFNAFDGSIPEPGTHRENTPDETLENTKVKTRKASQNQRQQPGKSAAPTLRASQLPNTPLALGALVGLSAVGAASASATDTDSWSEVRDAEDLGNICRNAESCRKQYRLIENINVTQLLQSIGTEANPFTGKLDGNYRTIGNLSNCLVKHLSAGGRIENLTLSDANITSKDSAGVVACEMSGGKAMISNIRVERADVFIDVYEESAAIGVGSVNGGGTITNMTAVNCSVTAEGSYVHAGIGAGISKGGIVKNIMAVNCHVNAKGNSSNAGIGVGYQHEGGTVTDTTALNCTVTTDKIGELKFRGGFGAGIGAGVSNESTVNHTTAVNCHVKTKGNHANAGIGAGSSWDSTVNHTTALNCKVITSGSKANAGIGAGSLLSYGRRSVDNTMAVNCSVTTKGKDANAGIGVGSLDERGSLDEKANIANTRVIISTVESKNANATISGGDKPIICNVTVIPKGTAEGCHNDFCTVIAPDLAKLKRQIVNYCPVSCNVPVNGEQKGTAEGCQGWQGDVCTEIAPDLAKLKHQIDNYCPDTPITGTLATAPDTTMSFSSSGSVTTTTPPTTEATAPDTTMNFTSPGSVTMTTPPANGSEVPKMTFSGPGSATFAAPTPPVASPSPAVIACIATLGTVIFLLVGVIAYRYYSQRSSTNAGRNRAEPMPPSPSGRLRAEGQLPTPPRNHYQPLSFRPRNKRPLPAPPSHYQPLTFRQGNTATGGSNPLMGNEKEPAPPDIPLYYELIGYESTDNHGEPVADGQAGIATEGSSSVANTGKPTRPGNPVYHVLTEHGTYS
ncbi:ZmpA/ZmpB/ZmpC family metallo-endopeptidase-related protein, partial [Salinisphaera sp. G21_0]|uniref:ZmpA/ZmpB/ZmpC family metallo-endopeptidase-related protein n=1 Tax=Salinisphaera sp. G21_0 TaxID=2821094 RepID=UPI001ADCE410